MYLVNFSCQWLPTWRHAVSCQPTGENYLVFFCFFFSNVLSGTLWNVPLHTKFCHMWKLQCLVLPLELEPPYISIIHGEKSVGYTLFPLSATVGKKSVGYTVCSLHTVGRKSVGYTIYSLHTVGRKTVRVHYLCQYGYQWWHVHAMYRHAARCETLNTLITINTAWYHFFHKTKNRCWLTMDEDLCYDGSSGVSFFSGYDNANHSESALDEVSALRGMYWYLK